MPNYQLTTQAILDLESISEYGINTWGVKRRDAFIDDFFDLFEKIAENPSSGTPRDEIKTGYKCRFLHPYTVFYIVLESSDSAIIGILHQSRDIQRHLK